MTKLFLISSNVIILYLLLSFHLFAQEQGEGSKAMWLQRAFPNDTIPRYAYQDATQQKQQKNSEMGFYSANTWRSIGPNVNGSGTGRIACVKFDPNNSDIVYVAAHGGGVWKST